MKKLFLIIVTLVLIYSCNNDLITPGNFEITYNNGDKDTINVYYKQCWHVYLQKGDFCALDRDRDLYETKCSNVRAFKELK